MMVRTSASDALEIATLRLPGAGRIGLTLCPGKRDPRAMTGAWQRDLLADLKEVARWEATTLVTLVESHELTHLGVEDLGATARSLGLEWMHLPIRDVSTPCPAFEQAWETRGAELRRRLAAGEGIVIHCRGGLGRTGLVAARLLIELGEAPQRALAMVRSIRPGAVEAPEQEAYVLNGFLRSE